MRKQELQKYVINFCKKNEEIFDLCKYNTEWILSGDYSDAVFPSEEHLIEYACLELIDIFVKRGGFKRPKSCFAKSKIVRSSGIVVSPYHLFMQYYSINKANGDILSNIFFDYIYLHIGSEIGTHTHPLIDLAHLTDPRLYMSNSMQYCCTNDSFLERWERYPPRNVIRLVFESDKEDHSWFRDLPLESFDWYESENWDAIASFLA